MEIKIFDAVRWELHVFKCWILLVAALSIAAADFGHFERACVLGSCRSLLQAVVSVGSVTWFVLSSSVGLLLDCEIGFFQKWVWNALAVFHWKFQTSFLLFWGWSNHRNFHFHFSLRSLSSCDGSPQWPKISNAQADQSWPIFGWTGPSFPKCFLPGH